MKFFEVEERSFVEMKKEGTSGSKMNRPLWNILRLRQTY